MLTKRSVSINQFCFLIVLIRFALELLDIIVNIAAGIFNKLTHTKRIFVILILPMTILLNVFMSCIFEILIYIFKDNEY